MRRARDVLALLEYCGAGGSRRMVAIALAGHGQPARERREAMRRTMALLALSALAACSDSTSPGGGESAVTLTHDFPPYTLESGQEVNSQCVAWTLNNEKPL